MTEINRQMAEQKQASEHQPGREERFFIGFVLIMWFSFTAIQWLKESFGIIKNFHIALNKKKKQFDEGNVGQYFSR